MAETKRRRRPGVCPRVSREGEGVWTAPEHERFLQAQHIFPKGPWKLVAQFVGTRSTRQTMTHAQKFRQKLQRRRRGLRRSRRDVPKPAKAPTKAPSIEPVKQEPAVSRRCADTDVQALVTEPLRIETEADTFSPAALTDESSTPVPSPLVAARDPTAFLFDGSEVCFQDLLLMPSDAAARGELSLPPFYLSVVPAEAAGPLWEEQLQALDALDHLPKAVTTELQPLCEFPGLDDALDYIIQSM